MDTHRPTPDKASSPELDAVLRHTLATVFAPWVQALDLRLVAAVPGRVELALPVHPRHVHGGGVLCGQTLMSACDSAMVLALTAQLGAFRPMTTVQLQTSFLRPVPGDAGTVTIVARVLKAGRSLAFGEIEARVGPGPDGPLAAHATTTYALL